MSSHPEEALEQRTLSVAALQLSAIVERIEERLADAEKHLRAASQRGVRLVVLPELSLTGFEFNARVFRRAEAVPGPMTMALGELARRHDVLVVAGMTERGGGDWFNALVVVGPDGYLGKYRKIHVSVTENAFWRCGREAGVVHTDIGRLGLGICADMTYRTPWIRYRERVDIVAIASAWPDWRHARRFPLSSSYRTVVADAVRSLPAKLSAALGVPVVHANCAGPYSTRHEPLPLWLNLRHRGASNIAAHGATLAEAPADATEMLVVAEVRVGRGTPDPSVWRGPWIPGSDALVRLQVYGTDAIVNPLFRLQYLLSRSRRHRLAPHGAA